MDIFEQLRSGADVDMATPEYAKAIDRILCKLILSTHESKNGRCNNFLL